MPYEWIDARCLEKQGVIKDYQPDWEAARYFIGGKLFCMLGADKLGEPILTLKLPPEQGDFLRGEFSDIVPGYYMNKTHWNSLYLKGGVPDDVVCDMIDTAYHTVFSSLSKKAQQEILSK